jgi:hypothetical protein
VEITGCHSTGGNDGPGQHKRIIAIFPDEAGSGANYVVHRNVLIAGNTFNETEARLNMRVPLKASRELS